MTKTILYFHGFKSSSSSTKAQNLKKFIVKNTKKTKIIIPDLEDNFQNAFNQIENLVKSGPNMTADESLRTFPPYLSLRWFFRTQPVK